MPAPGTGKYFDPDAPKRPRVVIIGAGFGGLTAAKVMGGKVPVDITLIDRNNHHTFQPLLYQVATAALSESEIIAPIRSLVRHQKNTQALLAEVKDIDVQKKVVYLDEERQAIPYDYLIVAAGARHSYFGHDEWELLAPGLKTVDDARDIRRRFLLAFEEAEKAQLRMEQTGKGEWRVHQAERDAYMTFVIVGGGATGAELAGVIPEIARKALRPDFRGIDTKDTHVLLLEGGDRILPAFPKDLSDHAQRDLEKLGVTVRTKALVTNITADAVYVGNEKIPCKTVFWAAGNAASPLSKSLGAPTDRAGRVKVNPDLSVPGHPEIFVIGDQAIVQMDEKNPVPWVAQGAIQQGRAAANNILALVRGEETKTFHYFNKGDLAVIGRSKAIANIFGRHVTGLLAWMIWLFIHIVYLIGFRNRFIVLAEWAYSYLTFQRGVRLITGREPDAGPYIEHQKDASSQTLSNGAAVEKAKASPVAAAKPAVEAP